MKPVIFEVHGASHGSMDIDIKARQFSYTIDEPKKLGGLNKGPNPVEYFLGSLIGCLNVLTVMIAKSKKIKIDHLSYRASGTMDPRGFWGKEGGERTGFEMINLEVTICSNSDDDVLKTLWEEVKKRCPVSDNILNATPLFIESKIQNPEDTKI